MVDIEQPLSVAPVTEIAEKPLLSSPNSRSILVRQLVARLQLLAPDQRLYVFRASFDR